MLSRLHTNFFFTLLLLLKNRRCSSFLSISADPWRSQPQTVQYQVISTLRLAISDSNSQSTNSTSSSNVPSSIKPKRRWFPHPFRHPRRPKHLPREDDKLNLSLSKKEMDSAAGKLPKAKHISGNQERTKLPSRKQVESTEKEQPIKKKRRKRGILKTVFQFLTLACALLVVSPLLSGEFADQWVESHVPTVAERPESKSVAPDMVEYPVEEESSTQVQADEWQEAPPDRYDFSSPEKKEPRSDKAESPRPSTRERRQMALSFVIDAVDRIGPSVLRIDTETHLLQEEGEGLPTTPRQQSFVQQGQGSGLIFSSDGLVLTNAHVVEDASKVTVTLTDGRVFRADVKGVDEIVDIAVLKILPVEDSQSALSSVANLPVAELGDSDTLNVGQVVVAVGSPGGLDNTVTMGIVSGLERSSTVVGLPHKKVDYIQTDCAVNPVGKKRDV